MVASPAKPEVGEGGLNECQAHATDTSKASRPFRRAADVRVIRQLTAIFFRRSEP